MRVQRDSRIAVIVGVVAIAAAIFVAFVVTDTSASSCPRTPTDAQYLRVAANTGEIVIDGISYAVFATAILDRLAPLADERAEGSSESARREPLAVNASLSAASREALGDPEFTCVRVSHGSGSWARRPTTYPTQTSADAYPAGAPPPTPNEAWRRASAYGGPDLPVGARIDLELTMRVRGRSYVVTFPPFALAETR